jgi:hypothetical protein
MDFNTMFEDHNDADYRVFDNYTQVSQLASDNFANSTGSFLVRALATNTVTTAVLFDRT